MLQYNRITIQKCVLLVLILKQLVCVWITQWNTAQLKKTLLFSLYKLQTHLLPLLSLLRASREITCPQIRRMGGFESVLCCLSIGQANMEWYRLSWPRSISICNKTWKSKLLMEGSCIWKSPGMPDFVRVVLPCCSLVDPPTYPQSYNVEHNCLVINM